MLRDDDSTVEHQYTYNLEAGHRAIRRLAGLETTVATGILLYVAGKQDATVEVGYSENEWGSGTGKGTLQFDEQREMVRQALRSRPEAGTDLSACTAREDWMIR